MFNVHKFYLTSTTYLQVEESYRPELVLRVQYRDWRADAERCQISWSGRTRVFVIRHRGIELFRKLFEPKMTVKRVNMRSASGSLRSFYRVQKGKKRCDVHVGHWRNANLNSLKYAK